MWLEHSKMLINEFRLDLLSECGPAHLDDRAREVLLRRGRAAPARVRRPPRPSREPACRRASRSPEAGPSAGAAPARQPARLDPPPRSPPGRRPPALLLRARPPALHDRLALGAARARRLRRRRASTPRSSRSTTPPSRGRAWSPSRCRCTPRCASGAAVAARVRAAEPGRARLPLRPLRRLNAEHLLEEGVADSVIGGEFESALVDAGLCPRPPPTRSASRSGRRRHHARDPRVRQPERDAPLLGRRCSAAWPSSPRREGLPALDRYATPHRPGARRRARGRLRRGQPRLPPPAACIAPSRRSTAAASSSSRARSSSPTPSSRSPRGARHITFGDPDFLNGVAPFHGHRPRAPRGAPRGHLRRHRQGRAHPPRIASASPSSRRSAASSSSRRSSRSAIACSLELAKGHTARRRLEAVAITRAAGHRPPPVAGGIHPWTTLDDYCALCDFIVERAPGRQRRSHPARHPPAHSPGLGAPARGRPRPWLGPLRAGTSSGTAGRTPIPRMDRLHAT